MIFLAHQGGWDEALIFGLVVAVGLFVLRRTERRVRDAADEEAEPTDDE